MELRCVNAVKLILVIGLIVTVFCLALVKTRATSDDSSPATDYSSLQAQDEDATEWPYSDSEANSNSNLTMHQISYKNAYRKFRDNNRRFPLPSEMDQHPVRLDDGSVQLRFSEKPLSTETTEKRQRSERTAPSSTQSGQSQNRRVAKSYFPLEIVGLPDCARNSQFYCEEDPNYPTELVDNLIERSSINITEFLSVDVVIDTPDLGSRIGNVEYEKQSLCEAYETVVFPKTIMLRSDYSWRYVVNTKQLRQGIRVEECSRKGRCSLDSNFPNGYISECQQKFTSRTLIILKKDGTTEKKNFEFPSCCKCEVYMKRLI